MMLTLNLLAKEVHKLGSSGTITGAKDDFSNGITGVDPLNMIVVRESLIVNWEFQSFCPLSV